MITVSDVKHQFRACAWSGRFLTPSSVAFCFPPGTSYPGAGTGWAAYAFIGEYRSFFNDRWCSNVSAQVHEIGHNMKLDHSNEDGAYGDASSMMGYSDPYDESPTMCFNGAKHWFLGWYDDRKQEINPRDGPWVGNVVAFVDYMSATGADKILLKVADYYIQYNRAKGINSGTQEKRDEITVTEASNLVGTSESIKGLSSSSKYFVFESYGEPARVEFCKAFTEGGADKVKVSVYLDSQGSACDGLNTPSPFMHSTPAPVPVPITAAPVPPTMVPTDPPTARPTVVPTLPPSPVPTADPTMRPTTNAPTLQLQPTEQPTLPPVFGPTPIPTLVPTTPIPTLVPTTPIPTLVPTTPISTLVPTTSFPTLRPILPPTLPPTPVPIPLIPPYPLAKPYPVVVPVIPQPIPIVPVPRQAPPPVIVQAPFPVAAPNPNPVSPISFQIPAPIASPTLVAAALPTGPPTQAPVEPPSTDPCDDKDTVRFPTDAANGKQTCVWLRSPTRQNFRDILCVASHPAYEICEETCGRCSDTCEDDKTATFKMGEVDRPCSWLSDRTSIQNQVCKEGSVAWVACKETCNNCVVPDPTDIDDCASGEMFFQLFLKTDLDPDETSWTLTSFDGSYAIVGQNYTLPEHSITLFKCLPRNHYQFVIYDKGNNGLMDGHGSYSILLDGTEVQSGGSFQHAEDTFIQPFCGVESATLYIDLTTDVYGNETSWTLRTIGVNAPLLAVSGGPYAFLERYLIADCVPLNACYEFAIKDAQGDGLCCDYGEGSYMLKFNDKIVMSSRFSSGFEEVTTFGLSCIDTPKTVVSHYGSPVVDPSAKKKAYDSFEFGTMNVAANIPVVDNLISDDEDTAA
jgi:hypothetical protein